MSQTTLTAPRCRLMYKGVRVARGSNVNVNVAYGVEDVDEIDNLETAEHAVTSYKVTGTIGLIGMRGTTVKSLTLFPKVGKDSDEHLLNVLLHEKGTLVLMDKATPAKNLMVIYRVTFESHGWSLAAGGLVGKDVAFRGIRETDEYEAAD